MNCEQTYGTACRCKRLSGTCVKCRSERLLRWHTTEAV
jgi:hypothetical protein